MSSLLKINSETKTAIIIPVAIVVLLVTIAFFTRALDRDPEVFNHTITDITAKELSVIAYASSKLGRHDTICITIDSEGDGDPSALIGFSYQMAEIKAKVVTMLPGKAIGAAALLLMYGDVVMVSDYSQVIIRRAHFRGEPGVDGVVPEGVNPFVDAFNSVMMDGYLKHLTANEVERFWAGEDVEIGDVRKLRAGYAEECLDQPAE